MMISASQSHIDHCGALSLRAADQVKATLTQ
jgi:Cft2 family RNA processing exonuclease